MKKNVLSFLVVFSILLSMAVIPASAGPSNEYDYNENSRFAVVNASAFTKGIDEYGDVVDQLKVLLNGEKTELNFTPAAKMMFGAVNYGDVFFYTVDDDGLVDSTAKISRGAITYPGTMPIPFAYYQYDATKWDSTLNSTKDIQLVRGILVGATGNTVRIINTPTPAEQAVDIDSYEAFALSNDCIVYTYDNIINIDDKDRLDAQGTLKASNFKDWIVTDVSMSTIAPFNTASALGKVYWDTVNVITASDLTNHGVSAKKFDMLEGTKASDEAQYVLALIVDGQVVEIYEILQSDPYPEIIHSGTDTVTVEADTYKDISSSNSTIKFGSRNYRIAPTVDIYVNDCLYRNFSTYYLFQIDNIIRQAYGKARLESSGAYDGYDKIYLDVYEIGRVVSVTSYSDGAARVKFSHCSTNHISSYREIVLDPENANIDVLLNGNKISLKDLKENDIIAIKTRIEPNNATIYTSNSYSTTVLVSRDTISGMVTAIDTDENKYTVDGTDYSAVDQTYVYLNVGVTYGAIFLDPFGRIAAYDDEAVQDTKNYAILAKVSDKTDVILILPDGTRRSYEVKDTGVWGTVAGAYTATEVSNGPKDTLGADIVNVGVATASVVEYTLRKGKINSIFPVSPIVIPAGSEYKASVSKIATVGVSNSTGIINVAGAVSYKSYKAMSIDDLVDGDKYAGAAFGKIATTSNYSFIILTQTGFDYNSKSRFAVVNASSFTKGIDEYYDEVDQLKVLLNGENTVLNFTPAAKSEFGTANVGDVFFYTVDSDGLVDSTAKINRATIKGAGAMPIPFAYYQYDATKWDTALNSTKDIKLVRGILVGATSTIVRIINTPVPATQAVDIDDFEAFAIANSCAIYTYDEDAEIDKETDSLDAQGVLQASNFKAWRITDTSIATIPPFDTDDALGKIYWDTANVSTVADLTNHGVAAKKFDMLEGTKASDEAQYVLALIVDEQVVEIYEILTDGYAPVTKIGDVNSDEKVNSKDITFLARYLAHWIGYNEVDKTAGDVNNDGKVNTKDITVLARHIAKWIGYDTLPYLK